MFCGFSSEFIPFSAVIMMKRWKSYFVICFKLKLKLTNSFQYIWINKYIYAFGTIKMKWNLWCVAFTVLFFFFFQFCQWNFVSNMCRNRNAKEICLDNCKEIGFRFLWVSSYWYWYMWLSLEDTCERWNRWHYTKQKL